MDALRSYMAQKQPAVVKPSTALLDKLNQAVASELQVAIQYMWQHVQWGGVKGFAVHDELKSIAIQEMKHAEAIAERLDYLGGTPPTQPSPILVGNSLKEMLERDVKDEEGAIRLYKQIIEMARNEGDDTTNRLFREILQQEENHHDTFITLLEGFNRSAQPQAYHQAAADDWGKVLRNPMVMMMMMVMGIMVLEVLQMVLPKLTIPTT